MLNQYYTEKVLGLQGVRVKKITETEEKIEIAIEMKRQMQKCPQYGQKQSMTDHPAAVFLLTYRWFYDKIIINIVAS